MKRIILAGLMAVAVFGPPAQAQEVLQFRALVDMVGQGHDELRYLNTNNTADGNFDPLRARLFVDGRRGNTQAHLQFLVSQTSYSTIRIFGAYVLHKMWDSREIYLEAGLLPTHDGIWAPQTYSNKNPLIGIPMVYYWKSNLHSRQMPVDIDQLTSFRGQGQTGFAYEDSNGVRGSRYSSAPMLYDNCWNLGSYILGVEGNVEFAAGVTVGAPAAPVNALDTNDELAVHARVGYLFTPGFKLGVGAARGAYLARDVEPYLPVGRTVNDYMQTVATASMDWKWRHMHTQAEYVYSHYDTPIYADGLGCGSWWAQTVYSAFPGWELAFRYDEIRYDVVETSSGPETWDRNINRVEGGVVYRVSRDLRIKGAVQATNTGDGIGENVIPAVQMSFAF